MASADIQIVNISNLEKIQSFLNDSAYREVLENSETYNTRLCIERRLRMPFLDPQTGVAQTHCALFMKRRQRMPGLREGQLYTYPASRWRKSRRQYLLRPPPRPFRFVQQRLPGDMDDDSSTMDSRYGSSAGAVSNSSGVGSTGAGSGSVTAQIGDAGDSKDSHRSGAMDEVTKDWFYDETAMHDLHDTYDERVDADSDFDYDETPYKKKKRGRRPNPDGVTTPRGRGGGRGRGRGKRKTDSLERGDTPIKTPSKRGRGGMSWMHTNVIPPQLTAAVTATTNSNSSHAEDTLLQMPVLTAERALPVPVAAPVPTTVPTTSLHDEDSTSSADNVLRRANERVKAAPSPYCDFCLGDQRENKKTNTPEDLVSCSDCGRSGHPSCLQFTPNMIISVKRYRWQCIECKYCSICGTSDNDDQLLFCDDCDRGYHMYCLKPALTVPPEGSWSCMICHEEFHSGK